MSQSMRPTSGCRQSGVSSPSVGGERNGMRILLTETTGQGSNCTSPPTYSARDPSNLLPHRLVAGSIDGSPCLPHRCGRRG